MFGEGEGRIKAKSLLIICQTVYIVSGVGFCLEIEIEIESKLWRCNGFGVLRKRLRVCITRAKGGFMGRIEKEGGGGVRRFADIISCRM